MCLLFHSIAGPTPDANIVLWAGFVLGWYKRVYLPSSAPLVFVATNLLIMKNCMSSAALDNSNEQGCFAIA